MASVHEHETELPREPWLIRIFGHVGLFGFYGCLGASVVIGVIFNVGAQTLRLNILLSVAISMVIGAMIGFTFGASSRAKKEKPSRLFKYLRENAQSERVRQALDGKLHDI